MKRVLCALKRVKKRRREGFTLIEVILAFGILAICLCGILLTYINMFILSDLSRDLTLATNAVQAKMEEIKKTNFDNLFTVCPATPPANSFCDGDTFNLVGVAQGIGKIEICDNTTCPTQTGYGDLKRVRIWACFQSRDRVIGGDKNLDGDFSDTGEDASLVPVEMVTLIAK